MKLSMIQQFDCGKSAIVSKKVKPRVFLSWLFQLAFNPSFDMTKESMPGGTKAFHFSRDTEQISLYFHEEENKK